MLRTCIQTVFKQRAAAKKCCQRTAWSLHVLVGTRKTNTQGACGWRRGVSLLSAQNRNGRARAASGRQWLTCDLDEGADPASVTATRATAVALRFCKVSCACAPHTRRVHGISVRVYACTWGTLGMRLKRRRSHLTPGKRCACTMDRKHSCHEAISKTDHNH
jgi:hypothetical protein